MGMKIEVPPALTGGNDQQLRQLYGYLYRLAENLNVALNTVERQGAVRTAQTPQQSAQQVQSPAAGSTAYNELRALIVNTADVIHREMDVIETSLSSAYVSKSEYGTFRESIRTEIRTTAEAELAKYNYSAEISQVESALHTYILATEGYIRQGFLYDENGIPVLGIAIGQGIQFVEGGQTVTEDEVAYQELDKNQSCAFYTAGKVSFRVNGQEVAYVSNSKLYIGNAEITGSVTLGDWQLTTDTGFTLKWIGG